MSRSSVFHKQVPILITWSVQSFSVSCLMVLSDVITSCKYVRIQSSRFATCILLAMGRNVLFWALIFLSSTGLSQSHIEMSAGFGGSRIRVKDSGDFARIAHYQFGIDSDFRLSEYTSVKTGLHYSRRGGAFGESFFFGTLYDDLKMNYLEIPVVFVIRPQNFIFFVGPQYAVLLSAKYESQNARDVLNKTGFDIRFGGGFCPERGFGIQVHFVNGISSIAKQSDVKLTTNYFSVIGTYRIRR